jgi:hypothetical protein
VNQIEDKILKKHTAAILGNLTEHVIAFNKIQPEVRNMFVLAKELLPPDVSPDSLNHMLIGFMLAYYCIDEMLSANGLDELEKLFKLEQ